MMSTGIRHARDLVARKAGGLEKQGSNAEAELEPARLCHFRQQCRWLMRNSALRCFSLEVEDEIRA